MVKRGERLTSRSFTTNERVLIHLKESPPLRDIMDAPYALTQHGISESVGIRVNHVSRAMKALMKDKYVEEVTGRVRGEIRKRKLYRLTENGLSKSQGLLEELRTRTVLIEIDGETNGIPVKDALKEMGGASATSLLKMVNSEGLVDVSMEEKGPVAFARGLPKEEPFFGREGELAVLAEWLNSRKEKVLSLSGGKGMGKTSLASQAYRRWSSDWNTFWFSFQDWDTRDSFLEALSSFLRDMGSAGLREYLSGAKKIDMWEITGNIEKGLADGRNVLFLDEFPDRGEDLESLLVALFEAVGRLKNSKMMITQDRRRIPKKRSFLARELLAEMDLLGLDKKSCEQLLSRKISKAEFDKIFRLTEGNPLHIKLMDSGRLEELIDTKDYTPEELALLKYMKAVKETR